MTAAKRAKSTVTPRLRFPEFRETNAWTTTELSNISDFVTEQVGTTECTPYTVTSGVGLVSQQEKLGRTIAGNSLKSYVVLQRCDFAYNKSATKAFPQGFIARYVGDDRAAVPSSIFTCFRVNQEAIDPTYLDNLFASNLHGKWLRSRVAVGARAHGSLNVNDSDLMALPVPVPDGPASLEEQQKIADCLTSLDEAIDAQGRKVEALKVHKRGLMQQLFPREGETVPPLRFPEFRDAPQWARKTLGDLVDIRSGNSPSHYQLSPTGTYPFVKVEDMNNCVKYQTGARELSSDTDGLIPRHSLIFPKRGAAIKLNKLRLSAHELLMDTNMMALTPSGESRSEFLFYCISHIGLSQIADNSTIPQINNKHIIPFAVVVPSPAEQERIADWLSTLDTQIAAESAKLDALKTHKNGLMQQLFPSSDQIT